MNHHNTSNEANKLNGTLNQATGALKDVAGKVTGNDKMSAEGKIQNADGKAEQSIAGLKEKVKAGVYAAGDALEHAGDKLAQAGFEKVGQAVHKAGDKIEHSLD